MRCAAIVVNFHCADETLGAVESVLRNAECTIHVIDNSVCADEQEKLELGLPAGCRLLVSKQNLGFAAACNLVWQETKADYVLLLNPDARLFPGALEQLASALDAEPQLAAVAPTIWWDNEKRWLLPTLLPETARLWFVRALARRFLQSIGHRVALNWLSWQQRLHAGNGPQPVDFLSGAVLLLRRSAVMAAGGLFDERFFMFYEDADLSRRLRAAGFSLALVPQAQAVHHWRNRATKNNLMIASAEKYLVKHYPFLARLSRSFGLPPHDPFAPLAGSVSMRGQLPLFTDFTEWAKWLDRVLLISVSPTPLGFPAIFRPIGAAPLPVDAELWEALDPGIYTVLTHTPMGLTLMAFEKAKR